MYSFMYAHTYETYSIKRSGAELKRAPPPAGRGAAAAMAEGAEARSSRQESTYMLEGSPLQGEVPYKGKSLVRGSPL